MATLRARLRGVAADWCWGWLAGRLTVWIIGWLTGWLFSFADCCAGRVTWLVSNDVHMIVPQQLITGPCRSTMLVWLLVSRLTDSNSLCYLYIILYTPLDLAPDNNVIKMVNLFKAVSKAKCNLLFCGGYRTFSYVSSWSARPCFFPSVIITFIPPHHVFKSAWLVFDSSLVFFSNLESWFFICCNNKVCLLKTKNWFMGGKGLFSSPVSQKQWGLF